VEGFEVMMTGVPAFELIVYLFLFLWFIFMGVADTALLQHLTMEDGFIEDISALFWLAGLIIGIRYLLKRRTARRTVIIVFCFVCLVCLGEEISWGQRILHIRTPAFIADMNEQAELNIHNLKYLSQGADLRNRLKIGALDWRLLASAENLFRLGFAFYFMVLPFISWTRKGEYLLSKIGYYRPKLYFSIIIWLVMIISCLVGLFCTRETYARPASETQEMCFALFVAIYLYHATSAPLQPSAK
jgi:hypothetical protein